MAERKGLNVWEFLLAVMTALDFFGLFLVVVIAFAAGDYLVMSWQEDRQQDRIEACIQAGNSPGECSKAYKDIEGKR